MEYVEGSTLYNMMAPRPRGEARLFSEWEAMDISIQIADALAYSHQHGLIHRDVKPKNILLTTLGVARLTDLGLAQRTNDREAAESEAGKAYGTPYYISPEQIRGDANIDARADIYSFGAAMYHIFTGRPAFEGDTPSNVMHQHLRAKPIRADHVNTYLSARIGEIIDTAMAKRPEDRYQSMTKLLEDLKTCRGKS
jgi:serine/threonine-protein kinase